MKSIKDVMDVFEEAGKEECQDCGTVYKLYKTPRGVMGACKPCTDDQFKKSMNLPTAEEYRKNKEHNFICSFERASNDLKKVTVNTYQPKTESQSKAKQAAIKFVNNFDGIRSLALSGSPGLGKSHLAYAINKAVRQKEYTTLFLKSTDLLDHIKSTYKQNSNISEDRI